MHEKTQKLRENSTFFWCRLHMVAVMGLTGFRGILSWAGQKIIRTALCNMDAVGGSTQSHALLTSYLLS